MDKLDQLAEEKIIKKLQHPVRFQILQILENRDSLHYNSIKSECSISSSTLFYHLKTLDYLVKKNEDKSYSLSFDGIQALQYYQKIFKFDQEKQLGIDFIKIKNVNNHFHILSNPTRRKMLSMFKDRKKIRYSEFIRELKISSGNLFYHIKFFQKIITETSDKSYQLSGDGERLLESMESMSKKKNILKDRCIKSSSLSLQEIRSLYVKGEYNKIIKSVSPTLEDIERTYLLVDSLILSGDVDLAETILDELLTNLDSEKNLILGIYFSCNCLIIRGEFSKAQDYLSSSMELYQSVNKADFSIIFNFDKLFALKQVEIFMNTNKLEDAKRKIEVLIKETKNTENFKLKGEIFHIYGKILWKLGMLKQALKELEKGLKYSKSIDNPEFLGKIKLLIAKIHFHLGDTNLALKEYLEALEYLRIVNNPLSVGLTLYSMSILYRHKTEFKKAFDLLEEALKIYQKYHNANQIVLALTYMGSIKQSLSDYVGAQNFYSQALEYEEYIEDKDSIAVVYKFLAYLKEGQGHLDESIDFYLKATEIFKKTERIMHRMDCLRLLSGVYYIKGELSKTRECLKLILDLNKEVNTPRFEISTLNRYGEIFQDQEKFSEALEYFQKSHDLAEKWSDQENLYINKLNIGICKFYLGKVEDSKIILEEVLENSISVENEYRLSKSIVNLAKIYKELKIDDWAPLTSIIETLNFDSPRFIGYSEIYKGIVSMLNEEWSKGLACFEKALTIENLDFFEKAFCYDNISIILFNKWKASSTVENLSELEEFLNEWEKYCKIREIDKKIVGIEILRAKILINQLNFSEAKSLLKRILKESQKLSMEMEIQLAKDEISTLNQIIAKIKI